MTFGRAPSDLWFHLDRDSFWWSAPPPQCPLRFCDARLSFPRRSLVRFAWRVFPVARARRDENDVASDLALIASDGSVRRAGFAFAAHFRAGPTIAACLQRVHETWFGARSVYRTAASDTERPSLLIIRDDGRLEQLSRTAD